MTATRLNPAGAVYSDDWHASSTSSFGAQLTKKLSLPAGTYMVTVMVPPASRSFLLGLNINSNAYWAQCSSTYDVKTWIYTLSSTTDVYAVIGDSASTTFTNTARGGIVAVRVA